MKQSSKQSTGFARHGLAQAAPEAQKATPTLSASKDMAAQLGKALATLAGQSPDSSIIGRLQRPGNARLKRVKLHTKSSQQPRDHAGPSSSTEGPQTASGLEVPGTGSGRAGQKSGSTISQEDAARFPNAALSGHTGLSPSSAPSKLKEKPAGNGISASKLKRKHRQSLPTGSAVAADVPQRAAMSAQKTSHMSAGQGQSPMRAKLLAAQGNGAGSAETELTDSQRKKVCRTCASCPAGYCIVWHTHTAQHTES